MCAISYNGSFAESAAELHDIARTGATPQWPLTLTLMSHTSIEPGNVPCNHPLLTIVTPRSSTHYMRELAIDRSLAIRPLVPPTYSSTSPRT